MSDIVLNSVGQKYAEGSVEKFVKKYNKESTELTEKGRRCLLTDLVFFAFLKGAGYRSISLSDQLIDSLFDVIKHGDQEHQDWLKQAIEDHFAGREVKKEGI